VRESPASVEQIRERAERAGPALLHPKGNARLDTDSPADTGALVAALLVIASLAAILPGWRF